MRIVTYLIKYIGEFKFIFETILDYESGDQMGSLMQKKTTIENLMLGRFKSKSKEDTDLLHFYISMRSVIEVKLTLFIFLTL